MLRNLLAAVSILGFAATAAHACTGQVGPTIFEDNFADDSGGWDYNGRDSYLAVKGGVLSIRPNVGGAKDQYTSVTLLNLTFAAGDGDYCMDFILPKSVAADNDVAAGIMFLRYVQGKFMLWEATSANSVALSKSNVDTWSQIYSNTSPTSPIKTGPNTVNSLRVVVKDNKLTLFANDQQIKVIQAQVPPGENHFGIYVDVTKTSEANPVILIKHFKVTSGVAQ